MRVEVNFGADPETGVWTHDFLSHYEAKEPCWNQGFFKTHICIFFHFQMKRLLPVLVNSSDGTENQTNFLHWTIFSASNTTVTFLYLARPAWVTTTTTTAAAAATAHSAQVCLHAGFVVNGFVVGAPLAPAAAAALGGGREHGWHSDVAPQNTHHTIPHAPHTPARTHPPHHSHTHTYNIQVVGVHSKIIEQPSTGVSLSRERSDGAKMRMKIVFALFYSWAPN